MRRTVIELRFDAATDARLRAVLGAFDPCGGRLTALPHVSLAVLHDADDATACDAARRLAERFAGPIATRLASVGSFAGDGGVVFVAPAPSAELLALHGALHADLAARGVATWDLYRPGAWVPHCTLAHDVPAGRVGDVVARARATADAFGWATFDAIVVAALDPRRDLEHFAPRDPWPMLDVRPGLRLRPARLADADALFALTEANRPYLRQWLPWLDATRSPDDTRGFLAGVIARGRSNAVWAIELDGAIRGVAGFNRIDDANRAASIGYWLDAAAQGDGVMTACVDRLTRHAFDELGLRRVSIAAAVGNARSRAVAERAGFVAEGTLRAAERLYERFVDHVVYARVRDD